MEQASPKKEIINCKHRLGSVDGHHTYQQQKQQQSVGNFNSIFLYVIGYPLENFYFVDDLEGLVQRFEIFLAILVAYLPA